MKKFEREYIKLVVKHAKRLHISKERAFKLTESWACCCCDDIKANTFGRDAGKRLSHNKK